MCDNCRKNNIIQQKDMTSESIALINCIQDITKNRVKLTTKMLVDFVLGKKVKSAYINNLNQNDANRY